MGYDRVPPLDPAGCGSRAQAVYIGFPAKIKLSLTLTLAKLKSKAKTLKIVFLQFERSEKVSRSSLRRASGDFWRFQSKIAQIIRCSQIESHLVSAVHIFDR